MEALSECTSSYKLNLNWDFSFLRKPCLKTNVFFSLLLQASFSNTEILCLIIPPLHVYLARICQGGLLRGQGKLREAVIVSKGHEFWPAVKHHQVHRTFDFLAFQHVFHFAQNFLVLMVLCPWMALAHRQLQGLLQRHPGRSKPCGANGLEQFGDSQVAAVMMVNI